MVIHSSRCDPKALPKRVYFLVVAFVLVVFIVLADLPVSRFTLAAGSIVADRVVDMTPQRSYCAGCPNWSTTNFTSLKFS
jgi:hypothetical protein